MPPLPIMATSFQGNANVHGPLGRPRWAQSDALQDLAALGRAFEGLLGGRALCSHQVVRREWPERYARRIFFPLSLATDHEIFTPSSRHRAHSRQRGV